jgi:NTP pyrophosphatase (non-canonical NTP hydrolase)
MSYPDRRTFQEAHERMAPPRKKSAIRAGKERGTEAHEDHAAKTHAAINGLKFSDLRSVNVSRCARWHPPTSEPWTCADWSNALCGEAGELANVIKKIRRHATGAVNKGDPPLEQLVKAAADELADVVIYADLLAHYFGIDLGQAIRSKFNRVSEKYGFPERIGGHS